MPTALITGAAGFIGFFAAQRLLKDGYCVVGLDCMSDYYHVSRYWSCRGLVPVSFEQCLL